MVCKILIIFVCVVKFSSAANNINNTFEVPLPDIVTFNSKGFRVTIPAESGITEFRLEANINYQIELFRRGSINIATEKETNGKWILENKDLVLTVGDRIYYWIFVKKDRLGYIKQATPYIVKELVPYFDNTSSNKKPVPQSTESPSTSNYLPTKIPWDTSTASNDIDTIAQSCVNNTNALLNLQTKIEHLSQRVDLLTGALEKVNKSFEVPLPDIVTFKNKGFRISIPAEPEITEFKFQGNINNEIELFREGSIDIESQKKINGKWILENRHIALKAGDQINYWIFIKRDRLGYIKQGKPYTVKELVPYFQDTSGITPVPQSTQSPSTSNYLPTNAPLHPSTANNEIDTVVQSCVNNTNALINLQIQIKSLTGTIDLLMSVLETVLDNKQLTLNGTIPQEYGPVETLRFILSEKLNLSPSITSAKRNGDGSITFDVKTMKEKIEILKEAQNKLQHSKIVIS